jgi:cell division septation protein DedD
MNFIPDHNERIWRDPPQNHGFRLRGLRYVLFFIVLLGLLIGLWYLFSPLYQTNHKTDLVLIQADEAPYKIKAEDQGVPSVKHQDKLVYGRIRGDQSEPLVEHILSDPEPPLAHLKEEPSAVKMTEQYIPENVELDQVVDSSPAPKEQSIEDLIEEASQEKPVLEKKNVKGTVLIQLGSLKSYDMAESEWTRISKKHKDILEGLNFTIQKVDLGADRGIYYRLRTGPFESHEKANEACATLRDRKVDCLVVR